MNLNFTISMLVALILYGPIRWVLLRLFAIGLFLGKMLIRNILGFIMLRVGRSKAWREAAVKADLMREMTKE